MFKGIHTSITRVFSSRSPRAVLFICIALLLLLGWIDYLTGDYSLIVFYLIPVSLAAWFASKRSGLFLCVLSLITRITADAAPRTFSFQNSTLHYWNLSIEFLLLLIMSLLFSALRKKLDEQK
jgi:K+-sensing histidine kinase KdpD